MRVVDGGREEGRDCEGECKDVRGVIDIEGGSVEVEGESEASFKRKEDGGGATPNPVWKRREERYGLLLPPFILTLMLLVLLFTPKYCIPAVCDGVSDAKETSLCM